MELKIRPVFNKQKKQYYNPPEFGYEQPRFVYLYIKWKLETMFQKQPIPPQDWEKTYPTKKPRFIFRKESIDFQCGGRVMENKVKEKRIHTTWIGHATFLLQFETVFETGERDVISVVTDPVFNKRASPSKLFGPSRLRALPPELHIQNLPPIDIVVISHAHHDHFCQDSAKQLLKANPDVKFYVPEGMNTYFKGMENAALKEFTWGDSVSFSPYFDVMFAPSQHWSNRRGARDFNQALWGSWVLSFHSRSVFFVGDTGYNSYLFKSLAQSIGAPFLSLIPIGAYKPDFMMKMHHISPREAVKVFEDTQSENAIAMHFATFVLSDEPVMEPKQLLESELEKKGIRKSLFKVPHFGETFLYNV